MPTPQTRGLQISFEIEARGGYVPTPRQNYKPGRSWYPREPVAKRSPILGYNHNVRYRGVVFHVQTEDSGLLNPHLFTHLFHEGVIVSTRKLVYDAGSNEEAIKALMQAQHKAVMKDLRKGTFDEKIDQYMSHVPGLEPRGSGEGKRKTDTDPSLATIDSGPIAVPAEAQSAPAEGVPTRAETDDRTVPVSEPAVDGDIAAAVSAANTASEPPERARTKTAQKVSRAPTTDVARAPTQLAAKPVALESSSAVIEISVDDDHEPQHGRSHRDTQVDAEDIASPPSRTSTPSRPPSHGAATLPAMKAPSRPIAPPVVTRPATQERKRPDSDVVEVYSPPPASAEPPPGERSERPGQYSMSRKEGAAPIREKTGRLTALDPARENRPGTRPPGTRESRPPTQQPPRSSSQPPPTPPQRAGTAVAGSRVPPPQTQNRVHSTSPITNRTPSPAPPAAGSGVVMTRPAVIVGAPPKPQQPQQRVRKAREDEGRGFGQGLISEKSLDEVILAYLSEDADDK